MPDTSEVVRRWTGIELPLDAVDLLIWIGLLTVPAVPALRSAA